MTIDATGLPDGYCRKDYRNYFLSVKNNPELLFENIGDEFRFSNEIETDEDNDTGHRPTETLKCSATKIYSMLKPG